MLNISLNEKWIRQNVCEHWFNSTFILGCILFSSLPILFLFHFPYSSNSAMKANKKLAQTKQTFIFSILIQCENARNTIEMIFLPYSSLFLLNLSSKHGSMRAGILNCVYMVWVCYCAFSLKTKKRMRCKKIKSYKIFRFLARIVCWWCKSSNEEWEKVAKLFLTRFAYFFQLFIAFSSII